MIVLDKNNKEQFIAVEDHSDFQDFLMLEEINEHITRIFPFLSVKAAQYLLDLIKSDSDRLYDKLMVIAKKNSEAENDKTT